MYNLDQTLFQLENREKWLAQLPEKIYFNFVHYLWFFIYEDRYLNNAIEELLGKFRNNDFRYIYVGKRIRIGGTLEEQACIGIYLIVEAIEEAKRQKKKKETMGLLGLLKYLKELHQIFQMMNPT